MTATEMKRRLQGLNIQEATEEAVEMTAEEFVTFNTAQLYAGKNALGRPIAPGYAWETYADKKHAMNPKPGYGIPDAYLTGAFYSGFGISAQGGQVIEDSDVEYADKLFEKYDHLGGLDPENLDRYRSGPFKEALKQRVEAKLYG